MPRTSPQLYASWSFDAEQILFQPTYDGYISSMRVEHVHEMVINKEPTVILSLSNDDVPARMHSLTALRCLPYFDYRSSVKMGTISHY